MADSGETAPLIGRRVVDRETGMVGTIVGVGEDYAITGMGRDDMVSVDWDSSIVEPESLRAYDEAERMCIYCTDNPAEPEVPCCDNTRCKAAYLKDSGP